MRQCDWKAVELAWLDQADQGDQDAEEADKALAAPFGGLGGAALAQDWCGLPVVPGDREALNSP